jgi:chromosomal replication initiator protein
MSFSGLDPRLTFATFIVGSANRLANAAATRVAESPGSAYNPLVLYGASGLGKTHLLTAIGNRIALSAPQSVVVYGALEQLLGKGPRDATGLGALRDQLASVNVLLLDDVQFLAGRMEAQEELLLAWDSIIAAGGQIVAASDRPPNEIEGLDPRLTSRFAAGLVADVVPPEHETRVTIVMRRAAERGQLLAADVADALARLAFGSVRELYGGINRVLAAQELEERSVLANEVAGLLGLDATSKREAEFGSFLSEVSGALGEALERLSPEQRIAEAILRWEGEGYLTTRLDTALTRTLSAAESKRLVGQFDEDVARLRAAEQQIRAIEPSAAELARADVFRDPDMVEAAETLVVRVRERAAASPREIEAQQTRADDAQRVNGTQSGAANGAARPAAGVSSARVAAGPRPRITAPAESQGVADRWFLSRDKVLWDWPYLEDAIVDERA